VGSGRGINNGESGVGISMAAMASAAMASASSGENQRVERIGTIKKKKRRMTAKSIMKWHGDEKSSSRRAYHNARKAAIGAAMKRK